MNPYLLQSKLLDSYQIIEQLQLQKEKQQYEINQLHEYIGRLEQELHYFKNVAITSQNQLKFLQSTPIQQKTEHFQSSLPKTSSLPQPKQQKLKVKKTTVSKKKSPKKSNSEVTATKNNRDTRKIRNILEFLEKK